MSIIWKTKKINIQDYYKIIQRYIILMTSYNLWQKIKSEWDIFIVPVEDSEKYRDFYKHVKLETSDRISWGVTMPPTTHSKGQMFAFIIDSRNPFITRSNAVTINHENAHILAFLIAGTTRMTRRYDNPEGKAGTQGPAYVVLVHDIYYGSKEFFTYWISWALSWIPITGPYIREKLKKWF